MTEPVPKREEQSVRLTRPAVIGAMVVALGQVATLGANGFALGEVLRWVRGETCPMGEFGAWIFGMTTVFFFDLPLVLATTLLVWLARRQLPRWARASLLAGLAAAIVVPLAVLSAFALLFRGSP
jgi:hypothetical protein